MTTPHASSAQDKDASGEPIKESWQEVKREGREIANEAKRSAVRAAEERKSTAADYMKGVLAAVETGARELDRQGYSGSAKLTEKTAGDLAGLVDRLAERPAGELLHELEDFARERPALFLGGAFLAGFGGARFLKSSARRGEDDEATTSAAAHATQTSGRPTP